MKEMTRARLIPTSGISGQAEAEQRATSALLAVMSIVRDFSDQVLSEFGASRAAKAEVATFTEVEIKLADGAKVRPDGLIRVTYGKSEWTALVEVKTGKATLDAKQLNSYLTAAKEIDADTVISISNEVGIAGAHPTEGLKVRSNSRIKVNHVSWSRLLTTAVQCKVHAGVSDPEQSWILAELIRYLEHPASGVTSFDDMGQNWVSLRDSVRKGTLSKSDDAADDVATKWDELTRHLVLRLTAHTGADTKHVLARAERDPKARLASVRQMLIDTGQMSSTIRIPNTASDVTLTADLRANQVVTEAEIVAPGDKKGRGSVGWLTRQLRDAPADLSIEAYAKNARTPQVATLRQATEDSSILLDQDKNDIAKFRLVSYRDAGPNRRAGGKSPGFIDTVNSAFDEFYSSVLQSITPWVPTAPKVQRVESNDKFPQPGAGEESAQRFGRRREDLADDTSMNEPVRPSLRMDGSATAPHAEG